MTDFTYARELLTRIAREHRNYADRHPKTAPFYNDRADGLILAARRLQPEAMGQFSMPVLLDKLREGASYMRGEAEAWSEPDNNPSPVQAQIHGEMRDIMARTVVLLEELRDAAGRDLGIEGY